MTLHHLQFGHRRAEQFARHDTPRGLDHGAAGEAERGGADRGAEHIERRHCDLEALARLADHSVGRHAAVVEAQPRQRMRRDHLDALGNRQAGIAALDDEGRKPARARRFAGARKHHVKIGDAAVRNPGLFAVEHVSRRRRAAPWS